MHPYWRDIIEPLLRLTNPRTILEIGVQQGVVTERLLGFCRQYNSVLHSIDPNPDFDVDRLLKENPERFHFHEERSVDIIEKIELPDVVLIDGDHNWFTVSKELALLERQRADLSRNLPLILVHDVGWPYGRRDRYDDPEAIPERYRQKFAQGGVLPGKPKLVEGAGLHPDRFHASKENGPRNGVLTAVEDFRKHVEENSRLVLVPGFHGLAIFATEGQLQKNPAIAEILSAWDFGENARAHIDRLEMIYLNEHIALEEKIRVLALSDKARQIQLARLKDTVGELSGPVATLQRGVSSMTRLEQETRAGIEAAEQASRGPAAPIIPKKKKPPR